MSNFFKWLDRGFYQFLFGIIFGAIFMAVMIGRVEASVYSCEAITKLSDSQVHNLQQSYEFGLQEDLGYTLAAISWRESSAGKYRINYKSNDYGSFGINYNTVQRLEKIKSYYKTIEHLQQLVYDDYKGSRYAIATLKWNLKHHKGNWRKAVMHYHVGNKWWLGREYANDIALKVNILKTCLIV